MADLACIDPGTTRHGLVGDQYPAHHRTRLRHHSWVTTRFRQYGRVATSVMLPFDNPK